MNSYNKTAAELYDKASLLLKGKEIPSMLERHGKVIYTGSYALDLMVWPDIDIQVELDDKVDRVKIFTDLAYQLLLDSDIDSVKLINFTPGKRPGMNTGMYIGLTCKTLDYKWKIDIWALDKEHQESNKEYMSAIQSKLTTVNRDFILQWKHKILTDGRVPQLGSYMLYKAILLEGLTKDSDILDFLISNGVKLS